MQQQKSFSWLYQSIPPVVQIEECSSMYSQHFVGEDIQGIPTSFVKEEIFRGLRSASPYWGDLDPKYSLWLIRHSYFARIGDLPHHDHESTYVLIDNQSKAVALVFFQMCLGIVALCSVTALSPIWGHIVATVAEERQWCIR